MGKYGELKAEEIVATLERLVQRIDERFPDSGLLGVARAELQVARDADVQSRAIARPQPWVRGLSILLAATVLLSVLFLPLAVGSLGKVSTLAGLVQVLEASLGALFFIGAILVGVTSLETRLKRRRALRAVHQLRVLAHIVDMHQLTKSPERLVRTGPSTASSPRRTMTAFELGRYLDYCAELLAVLSKVGALYIQEFADPVAVTAVDEIEDLTNGLGRKIWQKIIVLESWPGESDQ